MNAFLLIDYCLHVRATRCPRQNRTRPTHPCNQTVVELRAPSVLIGVLVMDGYVCGLAQCLQKREATLRQER